MIDRYLERGDMFVLADNNEVKASCVITEEGNGIYEIKSIAVYPQFQRKGYGKKLIFFLLEHYKMRCHTMLVGTGDSPITISFTKVVDLYIHTEYPIFSQIIMTIRFLKRVNN